jgi:hypothetical protein
MTDGWSYFRPREEVAKPQIKHRHLIVDIDPEERSLFAGSG